MKNPSETPMNMNSPGIRPRNNKPAAGPDGKNGSQQKLRVLSEDGTARAAVPSIAMPRAKTESIGAAGRRRRALRAAADVNNRDATERRAAFRRIRPLCRVPSRIAGQLPLNAARIAGTHRRPVST